MSQPAAPAVDPKTVQPSVEPKKEEAKKPLTKEQLDGVQRFASSFLPEKFAAPKVETDEEKAAREKAEKEKAATKPKPKPPVRKAPPAAAAAAAPLTADQIAEAAARGVATAMTPKKEEPKEEPAEELTAGDKRTISVLERLEKLYPDKYKGHAQKFKDAKPALRAYAAQWEKDHPGQEFDENDTEHDAWYESNEPQWDKDDEVEALAEIKAQTAIEEHNKQVNERLSAFERKDKLRESEPEIAKAQIQPTRLLWDQMGPEFKGMIDENGQVNMEKVVELRKADPTTFATRVQAANALGVEVAELYKVMNGLVDFDAKNPAHVNISNFAVAQEAKLAAAPIEDRTNAEGKDFLPAADYWKLSKAKRENYWTFNVSDVAALRAAHLSEMTRNLLAEEEKSHQKWAESRGFTKAISQAKPTPPVKEEHEPEPEPNDWKPSSPAASTESRMTANRRGTGKTAPDPALTFLQRQLGKK
jgi:hypothetical protein